MVNLNDIIKLPLTAYDILNATTKALQQDFVDNLRYRPKSIQLDCKIRGYIGEIVLRKWFALNDIQFSDSNFIEDGKDMDIDLSLVKSNRNYNIEIKTSLVPDFYKGLGKTIERCDIKLIKRNHSIEDLKGNIHIQIYFNILRKERDTFLKHSKIDIDNATSEQIYTQLKLDKYIGNTYFVAWIDKQSLVRYINSLDEPNRIWSFKNSQRYFWTCNIKNIAKKPQEIITYIDSL